ncbi:MAG: YIP1 family protein [Candidatus Thermoplasmatota archaeon]|nr:YIP1 family protein [Candidatus Thermoplasmatota archaeon]
MDIMGFVGTAKNILFNPKGTLLKLRDEQWTMQSIIIYLAIVAAPIFLGALLGYGFVWWGSASNGIIMAILLYIMNIVGVIIFGFVLNALAGNFKSKANTMQAMKLVSFAATPGLLLGIAYVYPPISAIVFLGFLYGLYILYLGIPIFMETPKEQQMTYFIIGLIVYIIIMAIVWWLSSFIWDRLFWSAYYPPGYWGGGGYWHP